MRRLHIGCGKCYLPPSQGWVNVDLFSNVKADTYADMTALPFEKESFSLIYASHVLEHQHRHMIVATLSHWRSLLIEGGVLRIAVPDFKSICSWYNEARERSDPKALDDLMGLLYGGQDNHLNRHTVTFDSITLERDLIASGFKSVHEWFWQTTDHTQFDDYSQSYLPHLNKKSGKLMSLNLEAVK